MVRLDDTTLLMMIISHKLEHSLTRFGFFQDDIIFYLLYLVFILRGKIVMFIVLEKIVYVSHKSSLFYFFLNIPLVCWRYDLSPNIFGF